MCTGSDEDDLRCAGLFILHPDVLVSGTRVAGSFRCSRQAILEEKFGGAGNAKAVEGTLLHDLLQVLWAVKASSETCSTKCTWGNVLADQGNATIILEEQFGLCQQWQG